MDASTNTDPASPRGRSRHRTHGVLLVVSSMGVLAAALISVAITGSAGGDLYVLYGLPDPGLVSRLGLPTVRVLAEVFAVLCVGSLMLAAFGVAPQRSGILAADGYAAIRVASRAGFAWAANAAVMAVLTAADATGQPAGKLMTDIVALGQALDLIEQSTAWLVVALIALVVAIGCRVTLGWPSAVVLFACSVLGLLPVALTGHSAAGGAHDVATSSMLFHVVAAALWIGGLLAVITHVLRGGAAVEQLVRRYSLIALACWIVMATSGTVNALVRLSLSELVGSTYGLLVTAKAAALIVLGVIGHCQRRSAVAVIEKTSGRQALIRLGAVETLLMLAAIGVSVSLGRTPPPAATGPQPTETELLIGYRLDGPLDALRLLTDWRFDLVFGTAAIVCALLYLRVVSVLRSQGSAWPIRRTAAWVAGCGVVLLVTSSGLGRYMPAMFSAHLSGHTLLALLAGPLLAWGRPGVLAVRTAPKDTGVVGTAEHLTLLARLPLIRWLRQPVPAMIVLLGAYYGLYLLGPMDTLPGEHWAHLLMNALFLSSGFIFFTAVLTRTAPTSEVVLLLTAALYTVFCLQILSTDTVIGENFHRSLALPWLPDLLADQRHGAVLALALGGPVLIVTFVWVVAARRRNRSAQRRLPSREPISVGVD